MRSKFDTSTGGYNSRRETSNDGDTYGDVGRGGHPSAGLGGAALGSDRNPGTAQTNSRYGETGSTDNRGADGYFGGNGPGDGSISVGTRGASSRSDGGDDHGMGDGPSSESGGNSGSNNGGSTRSGGSYDDYVDSGSCFVAGTPVLMADGSAKPIEQVTLEDQVMAFDGLGRVVTLTRFCSQKPPSKHSSGVDHCRQLPLSKPVEARR